MINTKRAELIADLRLNHEYCPKESILKAADMLESDAQPRQVTCKIYGHVVGACVECNTHIEAQQVVPAWTIAAERVPLSESLIGEFYMGVAGAQPTLLTRQLFTGIVKAVEQAHNIKES